MNKIAYFGTEKDIKKAAAVLNRHRKLARMKEGEARLKIQSLIDKYNLKAAILINGNAVWSRKRILTNLHRIMKHGTLYQQDHEQPILSHYLYEFLTQTCGSISHFDIHGWVHHYPTIGHLRKFFKINEFGKRVLEWIPEERTDAKAIVQEIETLLFPFQSYVEAQSTTQNKRAEDETTPKNP